MKVVVISDIHGSKFYANKIIEIMNDENPDKLILLGDLYYHGPRNPLTGEYNPGEVANILNSFKDKIIAIKGNCDAEVDEMISEFKLNEYLEVEINNRKVFLSHGHKYNIDSLPPVEFDVMLYGHFHMGFIHEENGMIIANPGSISLPKNNTKNSYLVIDEEKISLKDINGEVIVEKGWITIE